MSVMTKSARWALIIVATASMAACARPKPQPELPVSQPPVSQPQTQATPTQPAQPPRSTQLPPPATSQGPVPGSVQDFVVNVGDRVYFDLDQYQVRADARPVLDAQAAWLARYPQVAIRIEGNADERGTREYNFALGARRAEAVRAYLIGRGVAASRIETVSYGKERPIDPGSSEAAWQRNRNAHTAITGGSR